MQTTLSASSRTYSVLLILYPLELRREFAQEMTCLLYTSDAADE